MCRRWLLDSVPCKHSCVQLTVGQGCTDLAITSSCGLELQQAGVRSAVLPCSSRKGSATRSAARVTAQGQQWCAIMGSELTGAWDSEQCSCQCHSMWEGLCQQGIEDHSLSLQVGLQVAVGTKPEMLGALKLPAGDRYPHHSLG